MPKELSNNTVSVTCTGCSNKFSIISTLGIAKLSVETCNKCHPAYTGVRQKVAAGALEKFASRYEGFEGVFD